MKVITIGRSEECSIVVNDVKVSRVHAQLVQDDEGKVSVVDLGSTNGTWVNNNRIFGEMRLNPNDQIRIGDTLLPWQTYINNISSQQVQPEISHSAASTTVLEAADGAPAEQPEKKTHRKNTLWIVIAIVLALLVGGGVVWLLVKPSAEKSSTQSGTNTNTPTAKQAEQTGDTTKTAFEKAIINEADSLKNELKKTQDELGQAKSDNKYLGARSKTLEREFKDKMEDAQGKHVAIKMTYRRLVDIKLINRNEDLYDSTYSDVATETYKYHEARCNAIKSCFKLNQDKRKEILTILESEMLTEVK